MKGLALLLWLQTVPLIDMNNDGILDKISLEMQEKNPVPAKELGTKKYVLNIKINEGWPGGGYDAKEHIIPLEVGTDTGISFVRSRDKNYLVIHTLKVKKEEHYVPAQIVGYNSELMKYESHKDRVPSDFVRDKGPKSK